MAYTDYKFGYKQTIASVANSCGTSIAEILKINNISPPYPVYVDELPEEIIKDGTIKTPIVANGNQSFENYAVTAYQETGINYKKASRYMEQTLTNYALATTPVYDRMSTGYGLYTESRSPGRNNPDCYIIIGGIQWSFPCYPQSISDNNTANYNPTTILGRSEPFQYYTSSGPRTVSVDFQMHCEMIEHNGSGATGDYTYVYRLVNAIESACYPTYGSSIAATKVHLKVANNIRITGIISNVSTKYDGTILDMGSTDNSRGPMTLPKYSMVSVSFSITEVSGTPFSQADIATKGGMR